MNLSQPNDAGTPEPGHDAPKAPEAPGAASTPAGKAATKPYDGSAPVGTAARTVESEEILQGAQELLIKHQGTVYRLRRTRNGKLILHK